MNPDRFVDSQLTGFANLVHNVSVFCMEYWITFGKLSAGSLTQQKKIENLTSPHAHQGGPTGLGSGKYNLKTAEIKHALARSTLLPCLQTVFVKCCMRTVLYLE